MRTLADALAFCAALGAQPADDLDHLFHARQWFKLQSAFTDRSPSLMRAAVATAFNDPETAERLLRDVIRSAPTSNAADEAYGRSRRWTSGPDARALRAPERADRFLMYTEPLDAPPCVRSVASR